MTVAGVGANASRMVQTLIELRSRLADLQRQLGTGRKAESYAGMGIDRALAVGLRARLSALAGYGDTLTVVGVRLNVAQSALGQIGSLGQAVKGLAVGGEFVPGGGGQTINQQAARGRLDALLDLLNSRAGDRYLFSGRAGDRMAVAAANHILDGDGVRAGLRQIIAERNQADLGGDGLGRLVIPATAGAVVSAAEDAAGSPFGFKLAGIVSTLTGATVTGPSGTPAGVSVDLGTTNPNAGEFVRFVVALPDGSSEDLTLTATTASPPGAGAFTIAATPAQTAANLRAALVEAVGTLARTALAAASAVAAARDFFDIDGLNPPRRVAGPPFDSATALVAGTAADTVIWYTGEAGSDPARATAVARIDEHLAVSYGLRANEEAIRAIAAHVAVFAAMTFSAGDPDASGRYQALARRVVDGLADQSGVQRIADIEIAIATAQTTLAAAAARHQQMRNTLGDLLQHIEGVPQEQVAAEILALQTRLQASLQTTALLHHTSLVNYL